MKPIDLTIPNIWVKAGLPSGRTVFGRVTSVVGQYIAVKTQFGTKQTSAALIQKWFWPSELSPELGPPVIRREFNPRFASLVQAGTKKQTIRPGELNAAKRAMDKGGYLEGFAWSAAPYRAKTRVVVLAPITHVLPVKVSERKVEVDGQSLNDSEVVDLAIEDGFINADDFFQWFTPPKRPAFSGYMIMWNPGRRTDI